MTPRDPRSSLSEARRDPYTAHRSMRGPMPRSRTSPQLPHKPAARLRELMDERNRAQSEAGDIADKARQEVAGLMRGGELKPATAANAARRSKLGRKKR